MTKMTGRMIVITFLFVSLSAHSAVQAEDWPQWLGARRDSVWRETGIVDTLPPGGPRQLWSQSVGAGYAGPAVARGRVFVADFLTSKIPEPAADRRDSLQGQERVLCLSANTGELLWKYEHDCAYHISYSYGPRVTPTVDQDRVYTLGAEGDLLCLRVADGSKVWSKRLTEAYNFKTPMWGFAGHPLVDGHKLICLVGGQGSIAVAFNKETGDELWHSLSAKEPGYSSPTMIEAGGKRQLLIWHPESLNSLNPETGELYWSEELKPDWGMSIAVPRQDGRYLFVGAIVGKSMLLRLADDRPTAEFVWSGKKGRGLTPVFNSPFAEDGYMYGVDRRGELRCVELASGKQEWSTYAATDGDRPTDNASAFLVKQGVRFFIFNDQGELIIAHLSPQGYDEVSRARILDPLSKAYGRHVLWSHPAFAQKCIFARNDQEIVCCTLAQE